MSEKRESHQRNSNIEGLRLFAMFLIVVHHFYVHNGSELASLPDSLLRDAYSVYGTVIGKVGVALFVIISVWYTNEKTLTFKKQVTRWLTLEKELLFYSILLCLVIPVISDISNFDHYHILRAFFPVLKRVWWFISDYMLMILVLPFVRKGLKVLNRTEHFQITAILVTAYAFLEYLSLWVSDNSNFIMMLTIICITYYCKWYIGQDGVKQYKRRIVTVLCVGIIALPVLYALSLASIPLISSVSKSLFNSVSSAQSIIVLCIAFSIFLIVEALPERHNRVVNYIARSSLAVYLISDVHSVRSLLWKRWFTFSNLGKYALVIGPCICAVVMAVCLGIDCLRRSIFARTIDRHPGKYIGRLVDRLFPETKYSAGMYC